MESEYSIAIIGLAGRFPKADNVEQFWENLKNGRDCITRNSALDDASTTGAYGVLENIGEFDADFFDISPKEAADLDPQERIMLELTHHLLENSGCSSSRYSGTVGLYLSFDHSVYVWNKIMRSGRSWYEQYQFNKIHIAARCEHIAYKFGFNGPAVMIDYACASSAYSVHEACQALLNYDCDMAIAGGITAEPEQSSYVSGINTMSNTGITRPFDKRADGFVPGCAAGLVALKRYDDAVREHDNIIAVIRGTSVNNDGNRKAGFGAPSVFGQTACLRNLFSVTETDPAEIDYIEAHGTATELGDSIEARSLKTVMGKRDEGSRIKIGSVKSNIGHTGMAAGISNIIKTALILRNRMYVPTVNSEEPCDELCSEGCPIELCTEAAPINKDKQLLAVSSSIGMGGANVMALLAEYIPEHERKPENRSVPRLLPISGKTKKAAELIAADVKRALADTSRRIDDMAYTLQCGRNDYNFRTYLIADGDSVRERRVTELPKKEKRDTAFVFSGVSDISRTLGRELYHYSSIFRTELDKCFDMAESSGTSGMREYYLNSSYENIAEDSVRSMIMVFCLGYALARTLNEFGIKPDVLIGHSGGEYIAAAVSGIISAEDAMKMLRLRQELIEKLPEGAMLNVSMSADKVRELLIDGVEIGAVNAPERVMVSGKCEDIDRFEAIIREKGVLCSRLKVSRAGHCCLMDEITEEYKKRISGIRFSMGEIKVVSAGKPDPEGNNMDMACAEYWAAQMRDPVNFYDAVKAVDDRRRTVFIEIGASDNLTSMIRKMKPVNEAVSAFAVFDSPTAADSGRGFLGFAGELWCSGIRLDLEKLYDEKPEKVPVSNYPFERKLYWDYDRNIGINASGTDAPESEAEADGPENSDFENETEKIIAGIISDVLGYEAGPEDNLYDFGLDSLMSMMISSRVREKFEVELKISDMYELTSVRAIAEYILSGKAEKVSPGAVHDDAPEKSIDELFDDI